MDEQNEPETKWLYYSESEPTGSDPQTLEYANYLSECSPDTVFSWLVKKRSIPTETITKSKYWFTRYKNEPEWSELIDTALLARPDDNHIDNSRYKFWRALAVIALFFIVVLLIVSSNT